MLQPNLLKTTVAMAKEMTLDAISLLSEALLRKPVKARAAGCVSTYRLNPCDICGSCGAEKRKYYWVCWWCDDYGRCMQQNLGCLCGDYC